jgi:hypothetical protein
LTSLASAVIIPVYKYYSTPKPFTATFHIEEVALPSMVPHSVIRAVPSPGHPKADTPADTPEPEFGRFWKDSNALLALTIRNSGTTARHAISIRISYVHGFGAVGIRSTPFQLEIEKWREPVFRENDQFLEFSALSELPVASNVELSVWGQFDGLFRDIQVRSAEGLAYVEEEQLLSGWPVTLAANLWWVSALICLG